MLLVAYGATTWLSPFHLARIIRRAPVHVALDHVAVIQRNGCLPAGRAKVEACYRAPCCASSGENLCAIMVRQERLQSAHASRRGGCMWRRVASRWTVGV